MAYKVINKFKDLEDNGRRYKVGDEYPQGDYKPSKERINLLSKKHPEQKRVFIKEVKENKKTEAKKPTSKK